MSQPSLHALLDAPAEDLFFQRPLPADRRAAIARAIADRQGQPGAYAGMFAPTSGDAAGVRLFTGERIRTRAGIGHLLGEEGCRLLTLLGVEQTAVQSALARAVAGMTARLVEAEARGQRTSGLYCCGTCTAGYWRNLALGLYPQAEATLRAGLAHLAGLRRPDGTWRRFPFFFTSLALTEIDPALTRAELRHAAPRWRKLLPRLERAASRDAIARRRAAVGDRLLALCA